jgi:hypothetical protein
MGGSGPRGWLAAMAAPYAGALRIPGMRRLYLTVLLGFTAWSAVSAYSSVWLATQLHLSTTVIAAAFGCTGVAGAAGSVLGGHVVTRYGVRPVMLAGSVGQVLLSLLLFNPREGAVPAIAGLTCVTLLQPLRGVAQRSMLSAIAAQTDRELAFTAFRSAMNLGVLAGPALLSVALLEGWGAAHVLVIALFAAAAAAAAMVGGPRAAPGAGDGGAGEPGADGEAADARNAEGFSVRRIVRDRRLVLLIAVTTGAWTLVSAIEIVLPGIVTVRHQIPVPVWGWVYAAASLVVVIVQLPAGQRLSRWPLAPRLVAGAAALGVALIPELALGGLAPVCCALTMLIVGEVVWGPPSEEIVVAAAPPGRVVEYLGAVGISIWIGESCAGVIGFLVAGGAGLSAAWISFAVIGAATAGVYYLVARRLYG